MSAKKHTPRQEGRIYRKINGFLSSGLFLRLILVLFVLQALWIAFSFRYPMLYDEGYHFDLIRLYSHSYSPILSSQPQSLDMYGDLVHHGSTLFHYLLSFPFRAVAYLTTSLPAQVIAMRLLNIALFLGGLTTFAAILKQLKIRQVFINISLLFFILLPVVPFIAATVNYDNLLFFLNSIFLFLGLRIYQSSKPNWIYYLEFLIIGVLALLVKIEFIPIFLISILIIIIDQWLRFRGELLSSIVCFAKESKRSLVLLAVCFVMANSLLVITYGRDLVEYHTLLPTCQQTIGANRCTQNFVTQQHVQLSATKNQRPALPIISATKTWLNQMETFAGLTGINLPSGQGGTIYAAPIKIARQTWYVLSIVGVAGIIIFWKKIPKVRGTGFLLSISSLYIFSVYIFNMHTYYKYHAFTAVQPRYLLQTLPIIIVLMVLALNKALSNIKVLKPVILFVALIFMLDGGGVVTHIYRSNDSWYWQKPKIVKTNNKIKLVVNHLVVQ